MWDALVVVVDLWHYSLCTTSRAHLLRKVRRLLRVVGASANWRLRALVRFELACPPITRCRLHLLTKEVVNLVMLMQIVEGKQFISRLLAVLTSPDVHG